MGLLFFFRIFLKSFFSIRTQVKYNNEQSPTNAIQNLHGTVLADIVHNKNEPIRMHFECNRKQQEENFPKDKTPRSFANGECYYWRTVGCSLGKNCPKIHVPINKGSLFKCLTN